MPTICSLLCPLPHTTAPKHSPVFLFHKCFKAQMPYAEFRPTGKLSRKNLVSDTFSIISIWASSTNCSSAEAGGQILSFFEHVSAGKLSCQGAQGRWDLLINIFHYGEDVWAKACSACMDRRKTGYQWFNQFPQSSARANNWIQTLHYLPVFAYLVIHKTEPPL